MGGRVAPSIIVASAAVVLAAAGAALVFGPTVNGLSLWDFTLDDAFITYRYSDHLAGGHGPVWNVGEDPVEGYTSFTWMLVAAAGIALGTDAEAWSKVLSLLAAGGLVLILALYGRDRLAAARVVALAGLTLSPAFLSVVTQGMETALAALLATGSAVLLIEAVRRPDALRLASYSLVALLATLTRPDLLAYVGVATLGLALALARSGDRRALRRGAAAFGAAFVAPGAAYLAWRWSYYGQLLPNTYYVKRGSGLVGSLGVQYVRGFTLNVAMPYLLLVIGLLARAVLGRRREHGSLGPELIAVCGVFAGALVFLAAGILFDPLQGHLWRFQMPIYPVLLLLLVLLAPAGSTAILRRSRPVYVAGVALFLALMLFPLHTFGETRFQVAARWSYDREVTGNALHDLRGLGPSMLVTESGAVPYYSSWPATDLLGLNSEHIAHQGLSAEYLRGLEPDLVMFSAPLLTGDEPFRPAGYYLQLHNLVRDGTYRFADAHVKTDRKLRLGAVPLIHVYVVRTGSPLAERIAKELREIREVRRPSQQELAPILEGFDIEPAASAGLEG